MIDFADSCSWGTSDAIKPYFKYEDHSSFGNPTVAIGANRYTGSCYQYANTGFGQLTFGRPLRRTCSAYFQTWSFQISGSQPVNTTSPSIIWRWDTGNGTPPILSLVYVPVSAHTYKLAFYTGGTGFPGDLGTLLYTSQTELTWNQWYSIDTEITISATPNNGTASMYINDVLDTSPATPNQPSVRSYNWSNTPTHWWITWANLSSTGPMISDIVVSDNAADPIAILDQTNTRLGPCRVKMYTPGLDDRAQWNRFTSATAAGNWQVLGEVPGHSFDIAAPDGDYSYIWYPGGGATDYYSLGYWPGPGTGGGTFAMGFDCYGLILGVAWNACLKEPNGIGQNLTMIPNPSNGVPFSLGAGAGATTSGYTIVQAVLDVRPDTGAIWTDPVLNDSWWGIENGAGFPKVTQMVLEKITSTRSVPFNCGQGSYSYILTSGAGI